MLGFGFALFLILVILSLIYTQSVVHDESNSAEMNQQSATGQMSPERTPSDMATRPLPTTITPETAADDLIDEALADRDDLTEFTADEVADVEEGN